MVSSKSVPDAGRSLPEDLASEVGLPRQDDVSHALHTAGERMMSSVDGAAASAGTAASEVGGATAETAAREAANAVSDIRAKVSETAQAARTRLGDGVDSLRGQAADTYGGLRSWASDRYDEQSRRAADLADRGCVRFRDGRSATEAFVSDNPLLVGVVGLAAGLLLGALLPRTRREIETIGPWADEVRDQGLRYAREMTHRGRAFVETALDPDNLDRAARRSGLAPEDPDEHPYEGFERRAHQL